MNVRERNYSDYGITDERVKELKTMCRNATQEQKILILNCCKEAKYEISEFLYMSLTQGKSYERMVWLPMNKISFYAYRRKAISILNKRLEESQMRKGKE